MIRTGKEDNESLADGRQDGAEDAALCGLP